VTWLLLTAYKNLPTLYPTVTSPTLFYVLFSHSIYRGRRTTKRNDSLTVLSLRSDKTLKSQSPTLDF